MLGSVVSHIRSLFLSRTPVGILLQSGREDRHLPVCLPLWIPALRYSLHLRWETHTARSEIPTTFFLNQHDLTSFSEYSTVSGNANFYSEQDPNKLWVPDDTPVSEHCPSIHPQHGGLLDDDGVMLCRPRTTMRTSSNTTVQP